jgi:hypothetical protein
VRSTPGELRFQLVLDGAHDTGHLLGGVDRQARHAAMADTTDRRQLEPVHAAVSDTHAVGIQRLGDDDVALPIPRHPTRVAQPGHAGNAAAFFVRGSALLDRAAQPNARSADGFDRVDRGSDAGLLVARAAPIDAPVLQLA